MKQAHPQVSHLTLREDKVCKGSPHRSPGSRLLHSAPGPTGCTFQAGQKGLPMLGLLVWLNLFTSICFASRQLNSKQRPGLHASGSKLGTCLFCLLWGTRKEQTASFVSQVGDSLHSILPVKRWRDAEDPFQS